MNKNQFMKMVADKKDGNDPVPASVIRKVMGPQHKKKGKHHNAIARRLNAKA